MSVAADSWDWVEEISLPTTAGRKVTENTEEVGACHSRTRIVPRTGIRTNMDMVLKKLKA